jgi:hypothetical protein
MVIVPSVRDCIAGEHPSPGSRKGKLSLVEFPVLG